MLRVMASSRLHTTASDVAAPILSSFRNLDGVVVFKKSTKIKLSASLHTVEDWIVRFDASFTFVLRDVAVVKPTRCRPSVYFPFLSS